MLRALVSGLMLTVSLLVLTSVAQAQTSSIVPGVPLPPPAAPPPPPAAQPGLTPVLPTPGAAPFLQVPRIGVPGPRESFGDRVTRCVHYGTSQGVGAGDIGAYTAQCAN